MFCLERVPEDKLIFNNDCERGDPLSRHPEGSIVPKAVPQETTKQSKTPTPSLRSRGRQQIRTTPDLAPDFDAELARALEELGPCPGSEANASVSPDKMIPPASSANAQHVDSSLDTVMHPLREDQSIYRPVLRLRGGGIKRKGVMVYDSDDDSAGGGSSDLEIVSPATHSPANFRAQPDAQSHMRDHASSPFQSAIGSKSSTIQKPSALSAPSRSNSTEVKSRTPAIQSKFTPQPLSKRPRTSGPTPEDPSVLPRNSSGDPSRVPTIRNASSGTTLTDTASVTPSKSMTPSTSRPLSLSTATDNVAEYEQGFDFLGALADEAFDEILTATHVILDPGKADSIIAMHEFGELSTAVLVEAILNPSINRESRVEIEKELPRRRDAEGRIVLDAKDVVIGYGPSSASLYFLPEIEEEDVEDVASTVDTAAALAPPTEPQLPQKRVSSGGITYDDGERSIAFVDADDVDDDESEKSEQDFVEGRDQDPQEKLTQIDFIQSRKDVLNFARYDTTPTRLDEETASAKGFAFMAMLEPANMVRARRPPILTPAELEAVLAVLHDIYVHLRSMMTSKTLFTLRLAQLQQCRIFRDLQSAGLDSLKATLIDVGSRAARMLANDFTTVRFETPGNSFESKKGQQFGAFIDWGDVLHHAASSPHPDAVRVLIDDLREMSTPSVQHRLAGSNESKVMTLSYRDAPKWTALHVSDRVVVAADVIDVRREPADIEAHPHFKDVFKELDKHVEVLAEQIHSSTHRHEKLERLQVNYHLAPDFYSRVLQAMHLPSTQPAAEDGPLFGGGEVTAIWGRTVQGYLKEERTVAEEAVHGNNRDSHPVISAAEEVLAGAEVIADFSRMTNRQGGSSTGQALSDSHHLSQITQALQTHTSLLKGPPLQPVKKDPLFGDYDQATYLAATSSSFVVDLLAKMHARLVSQVLLLDFKTRVDYTAAAGSIARSARSDSDHAPERWFSGEGIVHEGLLSAHFETANRTADVNSVIKQCPEIFKVVVGEPGPPGASQRVASAANQFFAEVDSWRPGDKILEFEHYFQHDLLPRITVQLRGVQRLHDILSSSAKSMSPSGLGFGFSFSGQAAQDAVHLMARVSQRMEDVLEVDAETLRGIWRFALDTLVLLAYAERPAALMGVFHAFLATQDFGDASATPACADYISELTTLYDYAASSIVTHTDSTARPFRLGLCGGGLFVNSETLPTTECSGDQRILSWGTYSGKRVASRRVWEMDELAAIYPDYIKSYALSPCFYHLHKAPRAAVGGLVTLGHWECKVGRGRRGGAVAAQVDASVRDRIKLNTITNGIYSVRLDDIAEGQECFRQIVQPTLR
ncbi:hypothetical protein JCM10296v2_002407 [Rhodotorula toruloides]